MKGHGQITYTGKTMDFYTFINAKLMKLGKTSPILAKEQGLKLNYGFVNLYEKKHFVMNW
jgi:uncharacterized protein YqgQ